MNKDDKIRLETMNAIRDKLKEKGADEVIKELNWRIPNGYTMRVSDAELTRHSNAIKETVLDTVLIMSLCVLHDEFGFGTERLKRYKERFNLKSQCLADNYIVWADLQKTLLDECKIGTEIRNAIWDEEGMANG